jgi:hypothetical protein
MALRDTNQTDNRTKRASRIVACLSVGGLCLILTLPASAPARPVGTPPALPPNVAGLISESHHTVCLWKSRSFSSTVLTPSEVVTGVQYMLSHPDYSSYHLLFAIRRDARKVYDSIPPLVRARVLASALDKYCCYDDWGDLDSPIDERSRASDVLLEVGPVAVPYLIPLLYDKTEARISGSDSATVAAMLQFRRCDYAYQFVSRLLGREVVWSRDLRVRDMEIDRLIQDLRDKY